MFTVKQIEEYVKQKGLRCPYCGSVGHVTAGRAIPDADVIQINQSMLCRMCKREWVDVYNLAGIIEVEQDGVVIPQCSKVGCDCAAPSA
jgi:hypothetical protein